MPNEPIPGYSPRKSFNPREAFASSMAEKGVPSSVRLYSEVRNLLLTKLEKYSTEDIELEINNESLLFESAPEPCELPTLGSDEIGLDELYLDASILELLDSFKTDSTEYISPHISIGIELFKSGKPFISPSDSSLPTQTTDESGDLNMYWIRLQPEAPPFAISSRATTGDQKHEHILTDEECDRVLVLLQEHIDDYFVKLDNHLEVLKG